MPKFKLAKLQAVSSKNIYSEHGLEPLIRPSAGHVCHSLIVVSYCKPGSADFHALIFILFHKSRALIVLAIPPFVRHVRFHISSFSTAFMKSFVTRTELLEFCPLTVT